MKDFLGHGTSFKFASLFVGTEQTEVHGTDFFDGSTLTRLCDGVWPPIPSGRASIIAARMDASRNSRNASLWRAGMPAYGGNMSSWSVILMTARCSPSMVALMPGWVLARSAPIQFRLVSTTQKVPRTLRAHPISSAIKKRHSAQKKSAKKRPGRRLSGRCVRGC